MSNSDRADGAARRPELPVGPVDGHVELVRDSGARPVESAAGGDEAKPVEPFRRDRQILALLAAALLVLGLLFLFSRMAAEFVSLHAVSPMIAWFYLAVGLLVVALVGVLAGQSWRRYRRLREATKLQRMISQFLEKEKARAGDDARLRRELEEYLHDLQHNCDSDAKEAIGRIWDKFNDYSDDGVRDIDVLETHLLDPLDRRADSIIERRAAQVATTTALASRSFDGLIVLWQSVALVDQISQLYAGRPGLWGTLRLLRRAMAMVVFAEVADLAAQALAGAVTKKPLAVLGGRATEGMANGLMTLRLGEAIRRQCRPAPYRRPARNPVQRLIGALANQGFNSFAANPQTES